MHGHAHYRLITGDIQKAVFKGMKASISAHPKWPCQALILNNI